MDITSDITVIDALLDGGAPPLRVMDHQLPIPRSWYAPLSAIIVVFFVASLVWTSWRDYHSGRLE
ncbi:MAG: hypothetical protein HC768_21200 [Acaryochloris sp. CRU_2_0]|nr:hypothetical protein [Acaryochloris sp. CRU_2_0]